MFSYFHCTFVLYHTSIHLWGLSFYFLFFQKQRQLCQRSNWPKCLDFGITSKADHHLDYIESGKILLNMIICNSENKRQASLTSMEIWIFEPPRKTQTQYFKCKAVSSLLLRWRSSRLSSRLSWCTSRHEICQNKSGTTICDTKRRYLFIWRKKCGKCSEKTLIFQTLLKILTFVLRLHKLFHINNMCVNSHGGCMGKDHLC